MTDETPTIEIKIQVPLGAGPTAIRKAAEVAVHRELWRHHRGDMRLVARDFYGSETQEMILRNRWRALRLLVADLRAELFGESEAA